MNSSVPKKLFFTKGVGTHKEELHSFELALRDAGIEKCNLVQVSSIFPPGCKVISKTQGLTELQAGAITYCVMSRCCSQEPRRLLAASVGLAIPADKKTYGISVNIMLSEERRKKRATTQKIWLPLCWLPHLALILILMKAGTRKKKYLKSAVRLSVPAMLLNRLL